MPDVRYIQMYELLEYPALTFSDRLIDPSLRETAKISKLEDDLHDLLKTHIFNLIIMELPG